MEVLCTTSSFSCPFEGSAGLKLVNNPLGRRLTEEEVASIIDECQPVGMIAGVEPLTRKVLEKAKNLKVISRCGIGLDSVDLEAAEELGIIVLNTPEAPVKAVAELALGLMLSVLRSIPVVDRNIRGKKWYRPMGRLLGGKTVGIIGCGRIGSHLAKLLLAFECRVIGYDSHIKRHDYIELVTLDLLLAESDLVSLHLPFTESTRHFISSEQLLKMKQGSIIVNTARGGLIDEHALYEIISSGHIAGAGLDCFEEEPYYGKLTELDTVVMTPHFASYAIEAREEMEQQALENLIVELKRLGVI